jgi:hypothetical protein
MTRAKDSLERARDNIKDPFGSSRIFRRMGSHLFTTVSKSRTEVPARQGIGIFSSLLVLLCHNFILSLHAHTKGNEGGRLPKAALDAIGS